jgi:AcrR family transcriptional regulator
LGARREQIEQSAVSSTRAGIDRRSKLIETAIRLFSERPYAEVSVEDIAADAGVATGLLYYHFKDKQGLYAAGLELLAEQLKEHIQAASDPSAPPLEQLLAGLGAHLEFVEQHPTGYRELLAGAASQPKVAAIIERERRERLELMVEGLPPEAQPPSPLLLATLEGWLHFVDGVQLSWLDSRRLDRAQVGELCARVLFAAGYAAIELDQQIKAQGEQAAGEPEQATG